MKKLRILIGGLAAGIFFVSGFNAATAQVSRALEVLQTNPDVRTNAMGDALAARQDRMSLFVSPLALVPGEENFGFEFSTQLFPKVEGLQGNSNQYNLVAGYKFLDRHAISVGFRYQSAPYVEYSYIDKPIPMEGDQAKVIKPFEWAIDLSYGFQITRDFSMSVAGNFVSSYVGTVGYTGGASIGAFYNHDFGSAGILGVSLKANDLGAPITYDNGRAYSMPASAQLSAEYGLSLAEKHSLNFLLGGRYFFLPLSSQMMTVGGGLEYDYNEMIFVRLGGNYGTRNLSKLTAGAGFKFARYFSIDLGYSHGFDSEVGLDVWSVGLSTRF